MNVLMIGPQSYTFCSAEIDLGGPGRPPRACFAGSVVVVDLRPLGVRRARAAAIRLPLADPRLPAGHGRSPWWGLYRWSPGAECAVGAVAPDVFATLARRRGARVLRAV